MLSNKESLKRNPKYFKAGKRKSFTFGFKLKIIKRADAGESCASIAKALNLSRSTVATIYKKKDDIMKHVERCGNSKSIRICVSRSLLMETMEKMLGEWVEDQSREGLHVSNTMIQSKALLIYETLKNAGPSDAPKEFHASNGWLNRFKKRHMGGVSSDDDDKFDSNADEEILDFNGFDCDVFEAVGRESSTASVTCTSGGDDVVPEIIDISSILHSKENHKEVNPMVWICDDLVHPSVTSSIKKENPIFQSEILFPDILNEVIKKGGYDPRQIWNVNETGLYWKKMPFKTHLDIETSPGLNFSKDRLSLLLGANANGDCKLKPMVIYHTENPNALENRAKSMFPVIWKSNKKAWITAELFTDWFMLNFIPIVKQYCLENNLPLRAILIIDNSTSHPPTLSDLCPNIKIVYLPPTVSKLLQPMNQTVTDIFKRYYLVRIMTQATVTTEIDERVTLREFWKSYDLWHCVKNIGHAWANIDETTLNGAWSRLCPQFVSYFDGCDERLKDVNKEIIELGHQLNLDLNEDDVTELMRCHEKCMSEEDLQMIRSHMSREKPDDRNVQSQGLTLKQLRLAFKMQEKLLAIFEDNDINCERSLHVRRDIEKATLCYRDIYVQKKKNCS